ncbi:MAG: cupin domain-containing protein [Candidatus Binatia bacterium]
MELEPDPKGFFRVADLPSKDVLEGIRLRSVHLENLMMTFVEYPVGSAVPSHHHRYEQITYVLEGRLEVTLKGEQRVLGPGEGVQIPANVEHSSRTIDGSAKALDAWTPVPKRFRVAPPDQPTEGEISG